MCITHMISFTTALKYKRAGNNNIIITFTTDRVRIIYSANGITDTSVTVNPLLVVSVLPTLSGQYCSHFFYTNTIHYLHFISVLIITYSIL